MNGILFTTTTCSKCPAFKQYLRQKNPFLVRVLSQDDADFQQQAVRFAVNAAPTLIVFDNEQEVFRTGELSELDMFLQGPVPSPTLSDAAFNAADPGTKF